MDDSNGCNTAAISANFDQKKEETHHMDVGNSNPVEIPVDSESTNTDAEDCDWEDCSESDSDQVDSNKTRATRGPYPWEEIAKICDSKDNDDSFVPDDLDSKDCEDISESSPSYVKFLLNYKIEDSDSNSSDGDYDAPLDEDEDVEDETNDDDKSNEANVDAEETEVDNDAADDEELDEDYEDVEDDDKENDVCSDSDFAGEEDEDYCECANCCAKELEILVTELGGYIDIGKSFGKCTRSGNRKKNTDDPLYADIVVKHVLTEPVTETTVKTETNK
jgi:hypothetical protein